MSRRIRTRPSVTPSAVFVSQHTAPALFGFKTEDSYLAFVNRHLGDRLVRNGKTVHVAVDDLRAVLREMATGNGEGPAVEHSDDDQPQTADPHLLGDSGLFHPGSE